MNNCHVVNAVLVSGCQLLMGFAENPLVTTSDKNRALYCVTSSVYHAIIELSFRELALNGIMVPIAGSLPIRNTIATISTTIWSVLSINAIFNREIPVLYAVAFEINQFIISSLLVPNLFTGSQNTRTRSQHLRGSSQNFTSEAECF